MTYDGKEPRFWEVGRNQNGKPGYKTNVLYVSWNIAHRRCMIEGKQCKQTSHSVSNHGTIEAAFGFASASKVHS